MGTKVSLNLGDERVKSQAYVRYFSHCLPSIGTLGF